MSKAIRWATLTAALVSLVLAGVIGYAVASHGSRLSESRSQARITACADARLDIYEATGELYADWRDVPACHPVTEAESVVVLSRVIEGSERLQSTGHR